MGAVQTGGHHTGRLRGCERDQMCGRGVGVTRNGEIQVCPLHKEHVYARRGNMAVFFSILRPWVAVST